MSNAIFAVARYVGEENLVNASCIRSLHCSKGGACELLRRCVRGESTVLTAIDERESGFTIQLRSEDGKTSGPSIFESAKSEWASPRPTASNFDNERLLVDYIQSHYSTLRRSERPATPLRKTVDYSELLHGH